LNDNEQLVQVVKGEVRDEELAAMTVVLLARAAAQPADPAPCPSDGSARWRRLERQQRFRAPSSWQV
jgi:hypothetical protein